MQLAWPLLAFLATVATSVAASAHTCTCKYQGGDAKQGETACIRTAKGKSLARCDMVLNNSSWTILDEPCDMKTSRRRTGLSDQQT